MTPGESPAPPLLSQHPGHRSACSMELLLKKRFAVKTALESQHPGPGGTGVQTHPTRARPPQAIPPGRAGPVSSAATCWHQGLEAWGRSCPEEAARLTGTAGRDRTTERQASAAFWGHTGTPELVRRRGWLGGEFQDEGAASARARGQGSRQGRQQGGEVRRAWVVGTTRRTSVKPLAICSRRACSSDSGGLSCSSFVLTGARA